MRRRAPRQSAGSVRGTASAAFSDRSGTPAGVRPRPRGSPSVREVARRLASDLRQLQNAAVARGTERYFKHEIQALGVRTPVLRALVRERVRPLRLAWGLPEAIRLCDLLVQAPELEVRAAGVLALGVFHRLFTLEVAAWSERWLGARLDNWALVDACCGMVLSPLLARCPGLEERLRAWSRAPCLWVRRAALVTLVPSARRGRRLDLAYRLGQEHFGDPEDLIHKATGWLLREAGKTDMPRLRRFLLKHGPAMPRTALRYAIERFPPLDRAELLRATRGGQDGGSGPSPARGGRR